MNAVWASVDSVLTRFQETPEQTAQDSAVAVAAATLPLCQAGLAENPNSRVVDSLARCGKPPHDVLQWAPLVVMCVTMRSGLKRQWQKDPRAETWQIVTDALKTQLFDLSIRGRAPR